MASADFEDWWGYWWSGDWAGECGGWCEYNFDLTDVGDLGNLCGQPEVWVAFIFESDSSITDVGTFIDDITLRASTHVPTATPTATPATPTATPTATPVTPTATPTTTSTTDHQLFLPLVAKGLGGAVEKDIGAEGGGLEHPYGASLELPSDSIPEPLTFSIEVQDSLPAPLPAGLSAVGKAVKFGPSGIYFGIPAMVRLPVPSGVDAERASTFTYTEGEWRLMPSYVEGNQLVAGTSWFSWFVVAPLTSDDPQYEHKALVLVNRTNENVLVSLRAWNLRYPDRDVPPDVRNWPLGTFDFWRTDQVCLIWPQGTYTFWVFSPRLGVTCWIGPYTLGEYDSPYCVSGKQKPFSLIWTGPHCFPGNPTGNVPGQPVLGVGSLRFTLRWSAQADLDLHVQAPDGYIWYGNRGPTANGGRLDRDCICLDYGQPDFGVENIFWPAGQAPAGQYTVSVAFFNHCGTGATNVPFRLEVLDTGQYQSWDGTVAEEYRVLNTPIGQMPSRSRWSTTWSR